jgi:hypothetical protein
VFTDRMEISMRRTAPQVKPHTPTTIPAVASLTVDAERLERLWAMNASQRREAARTGHLTLGEMLRWAARAPHEVPLVNGEWFFITALSAEREQD